MEVLSVLDFIDLLDAEYESLNVRPELKDYSFGMYRMYMDEAMGRLSETLPSKHQRAFRTHMAGKFRSVGPRIHRYLDGLARECGPLEVSVNFDYLKLIGLLSRLDDDDDFLLMEQIARRCGLQCSPVYSKVAILNAFQDKKIEYNPSWGESLYSRSPSSRWPVTPSRATHDSLRVASEPDTREIETMRDPPCEDSLDARGLEIMCDSPRSPLLSPRNSPARIPRVYLPPAREVDRAPVIFEHDMAQEEAERARAQQALKQAKIAEADRLDSKRMARREFFATCLATLFVFASLIMQGIELHHTLDEL